MKKIIILIIIAFIAINGNSQINITSNGYVMIGSTSAASEFLQINGNIRGNQNGALRISSGNGTVDIGAQNTSWAHFVTDKPRFSFNHDVWVTGNIGSYNSDFSLMTAGTTRMIIMNSTGYVGINCLPSYQLDVTGLVRANNISPSDGRLKENIKNLKNPIDSLFLLQGVTYNLKWPESQKPVTPKLNIASKPDSSKSSSDTTVASPSPVVIDSVLYNRRHIGFIAQDVQKIFPELVYADKNGILSMDYIGIIPLLLEALKQQQAQINNLTQLVNKKGSLKSASVIDTTSTAKTTGLSFTGTATLDQNHPNPFSQSTSIGYYLPETVQNATLYIYDMNGVQIKSIPITEKGKGSITIFGNELRAGLYLYTLVYDGQATDTKRMILTQ